jgi:hypothetical protein
MFQARPEFLRSQTLPFPTLTSPPLPVLHPKNPDFVRSFHSVEPASLIFGGHTGRQP